VSMHLQLADNIRTPPAVAATEQTEAKHTAATWVCDGVDLIELDGDHAGEERLICVVDDAATLHDVGLLFQETLGCPADIVRVGTVIGVEDTGVVSWPGDVGEVVVEVVGFGRRVGNFDDGELVVLFRQLEQLCLNGLDGLRCVVNESCAVLLALVQRVNGLYKRTDMQLVLGVNELLERIHELTHDDVFLIRQVRDHDHVHRRQIAIRGSWESAVLCFLGDGLRLPAWRHAQERFYHRDDGNVEVCNHVEVVEDRDRLSGAHDENRSADHKVRDHEAEGRPFHEPVGEREPC
jgi:hypothetical protein